MNQSAWEAPTSITESLESREPFILASPRELREGGLSLQLAAVLNSLCSGSSISQSFGWLITLWSH